MYSVRVDRRFGGNKPELFLFLNAFTGNFLLGKGGIRSVAEASDLELKYEGWNFNSGNYLFTTDTK